MLPILRFGVCRSSDLSIHAQEDSLLYTNALLQPSLGAMTALPMTGFHRTQDLPCTENNTLEIQLLSEFCLRLCNLMIHRLQTETRDSFRVRDSTPDSLVQRTRMRVRLLGSRICHKSHAIQLYSLTALPQFYAHKKTSPALLSRRQKKSRILCIFGLIARKNYLYS